MKSLINETIKQIINRTKWILLTWQVNSLLFFANFYNCNERTLSAVLTLYTFYKSILLCDNENLWSLLDEHFLIRTLPHTWHSDKKQRFSTFIISTVIKNQIVDYFDSHVLGLALSSYFVMFMCSPSLQELSPCTFYQSLLFIPISKIHKALCMNLFCLLLKKHIEPW